jgi:hypothetical protein
VRPSSSRSKIAGAKGDFLERSIFASNFKVICPVQSRPQKYTSSPLPQITLTHPAIPSRLEGRWPSSRTLGRVAVDAAALGAWCCSQGGLSSVSEHSVQTTGAEAYGKAVWFWHPWLVSSWRRLFESNRVRPAVNPAAMEAKGIRLQGERGISRQTTAQGMPGCSGCTCMLVCVLFAHVAHETAGASRRPAFPAPSDFRRDKVHANLGRDAPRECRHTFTRHRPA